MPAWRAARILDPVKREGSWSAALVVAAAVAVTVLCGYLVASWPPDPPPAPAAAAPARPEPSPSASGTTSPSTPSSPATSPAAEEEPVLAVLGDSFSASSATSAGPEWPRLLADTFGWQVFVKAADGSGYLAQGEGTPFGQGLRPLLQHSPDTVILAGGYHDVRSYAVPRVTRAADRLVRRLAAEAPQAQVVLVSPFSSDSPGPLTRRLSANLRRVAERHDVAYVDATRWLASGPNLVGSDGVHPTAQGQRRLATRMEQALDRLGVAAPTAGPTG